LQRLLGSSDEPRDRERVVWGDERESPQQRLSHSRRSCATSIPVARANSLAKMSLVVVRKVALVLGVSLGLSFSACGGSSEGDGGGEGNGDGNGGTGGTAPNTCPYPSLVNYGSGPGILCNEPPGTSCSDTEQFCVCGDQTIEGQPWHCVPTYEGCPAALPDGEPCDSNAPESCDYLTDARLTCTCNSDTWLCEPSPCGQAYPGDGSPCTLTPGDTCRFFLSATPDNPDYAPNLTCTCHADQTWSCPPRR